MLRRASRAYACRSCRTLGSTLAPALIVLLFAATAALLRFVVSLEMSDGARFLTQVVGGIGFLVLPLLAYSAVDLALTRRVIEKVARRYCAERSVEYVRSEIHKNHFTVVYRENGKQGRAKFRVAFYFTTWAVREVQWLPK
jgi:hypothetical protein